MQSAQHLGGDDLHLAIGLDQHPTISGQCSQGLLTQQFRVRPLACRPFGHQGITALHQAGSPRGAEAFFQRLELCHHRVQQLIPVVQEQLQALAFCSKLIQLLDNRDQLLDAMVTELKALKKRFSTPRRTRLVEGGDALMACLLYTSPSPRDATLSRMPSSA